MLASQADTGRPNDLDDRDCLSAEGELEREFAHNELEAERRQNSNHDAPGRANGESGQPFAAHLPGTEQPHLWAVTLRRTLLIGRFYTAQPTT